MPQTHNKKYEEFAFLSYECKPIRTKHLTAKEVLNFRDNAWRKYFSNKNYLNLVENKFGKKSKKNLMELAKINLKRKILEH